MKQDRPLTGWLGATFALLVFALFMVMMSRGGPEHHPPEQQPDQAIMELLLGDW